MADEKQTTSAVYVSWGTFKNAIDTLEQGIPNLIDRSAFSGLSWAVQSQLISAMKFLGLIEDNGKPTQHLIELAVQDEEKRKAKLRFILKERYQALFALGLDKATTNQLIDELANSYSVTGDTRDKALRFFVSAAQYSGVPMSRFVLPQENGQSTKKRRYTRRSKAVADVDDDVDATPLPQPTTGTSRTVELKSGGTLTVMASMDVFNLTPDDRNFVFALIDKLNEYENGREKVAGKPGA
jgi:hypothetical protein